jgi:hypothetical protein
VRKTRLVLFSATALSLVAISVAAAQQPNRNDNQRKPPKQTEDKGIDDPQPVAASPRIGERNVEAVTIVERPGGVVMGILDESFEDAIVATVRPDKSIAYTCLHGFPAGAKHGKKNAPPVSVTTTLEEK